MIYRVALALASGRLIPQALYDQAIDILGHESVTDYDRADGLLHVGLTDDEFLCRSRQRRWHGEALATGVVA